MGTITPPPSNRGTPAQPATPQPVDPEASMDVDSAPDSPGGASGPSAGPSAGPSNPAPTAGPSAGPSAQADAPGADLKAAVPLSDTDTDDEDGALAASLGDIADAPVTRGKARKTRDYFDGEIVDRWNAEFGDVFSAPTAAGAAPVPAPAPRA